MKTTRTYLKGCDWCGASGIVINYIPPNITSCLTNTCPVCNGAKVITVTEIIEDETGGIRIVPCDNIKIQNDDTGK